MIEKIVIHITLAFCILVIDTRKQFQLQTGVFLKRPDVVTFDVCYFTETKADTNYTCNLLFFFLLVLDVKAFSTLLTIEVLTHLKTSGRFCR